MKRNQPRQRPQQRAANTRRRSTARGGYRRRGFKSGAERGWRDAFSGVHELNLMPGRRQRDKSITSVDRASRSGAAKRRARGRRHNSQDLEAVLMRDAVSKGIPQAVMFEMHGWAQIAPGHWRRKRGTNEHSHRPAAG